MKQWVVYILECKDGTLYTGVTNDLERRIKQHNLGLGARYTRMRLPVVLKWFKEIGDKSQAFKEEYRIKQLSRNKKITLINNEK